MLKILTLSWNGEDKLKSLYPNLLKNLNNINFNWLIKDNGSSDNSIKYIKSLNNDNINIIDYKHNRDNFSSGCNFLYKEASPKSNDLILLLNNDVTFNDTTSLQNMINIIKNDINVGIVGAQLTYTGTNKIQHAGVVFNNNKMPMHFRANEIVDAQSSKCREFQAVTAACLLTRANIYDDIKMDTNLNWSFDDIFFNLKVKNELNKKIIYAGNTNISHEESASLKKNPVNKLFMNQNTRYLLEKWGNKIIADRDLYLKDPNYYLYRK